VPLHESSKVKSPCHIRTVASYLTDEKSPSTQSAIHRLPPSTRPNSLDYGLQVHLQTSSIAASKCISKVARSRPPIASPILLDRGLQVHLQTRSSTASKCISKLARLQHPSSRDHGLQVHLHTRLITASKCISKLARSRPSSVSLNSPDYGLQAHLQTRSITASECIYEFTRSSFSGAPRIALKHRLQPVQIYRV
jgi:hypothetical protein